MKIISVRNVNEALPEGIRYLETSGVRASSRNGEVIRSPCPVVTVYSHPNERVIFWSERDANPFLHFFEALWMLAGHDDVAFVANYARRMRTFSDDGVTLHGAYGKRWRGWFKQDQLKVVVQRLRMDKTDRRCVIQMWDADADLARLGKDVPCNTQIYLNAARGALDLTVLCRSNDIIWGAYGANSVHFSVLQEYLAGAIGIPVGTLYQFSNDYHAYVEVYDQCAELSDKVDVFRERRCCEPYQMDEVEPFPLMEVDAKTWDEDLSVLMDSGPTVGFRDPFFRRVATPLWHAHEAYKQIGKGEDRFHSAIEITEQCAAADWRRAAKEWIMRRWQKSRRAKDDGVHE